MIAALLLRQWRHLRWTLGGLALGLVGFEVLLVHLGAAFEAGPGIEQFLEALPDFIHDLVAHQIHAASFPAMVAFGFMHPAMLSGCLAAMVLLGTQPAGERESGVLELLLARPLPRATYLHASLVALGLTALLLPWCVLAGAAIGLSLVEVAGELPWTAYLPCTLLLTALMLAVGGFALWMGTLVRRRGTAIARTLALLLSTYVLDTLAEFSSLLGPLRWLSPFQYFHPIPAAVDPPVAWGEPAVLLLLAALTTTAAHRRFRRMDI